MKRIIISTLSRKLKAPKSLEKLITWAKDFNAELFIEYDSNSIYTGHSNNINKANMSGYGELKNNDCVVLLHDDVEILSNNLIVMNYLSIVDSINCGFICTAGSTSFDKQRLNGAWWNARHFGEARGFVFQGEDSTTMTPNYFGPSGKIIVGDGCFLACSYKTLKAVGLDKPSYLSSDWDFYDIHLTSKAFLQGLDNYVVPIIIKHESPGHLREGWFKAKDEFFKHHYQNLPLKIPVAATNGLPK